jgi:hypothetical protein
VPKDGNDLGQVWATSTNDSARAGKVGEYIESVIPSASATALTTNTAKNLTSISLTAGDWDVDANFAFTGATTTTVYNLAGSISTTSATHDFTNGRGAGTVSGLTNTYNNVTTGQAFNIVVPPVRLSLSATTTIYAVASSVFTTSTSSVHGMLRARRVR